MTAGWRPLGFSIMSRVSSESTIAALRRRWMAALRRLRSFAGTDQLAGELTSTRAELARTRQELASAGVLLAALERQLQVWTVMEWIAHAGLRSAPLVSVVLPTHNRCDRLRDAIGSVIDQWYPHWELLVVDDGSTDGTPAILGSLEDPRIRVFACEGRGVCAARNVALSQAKGELVAYLDDDNLMHPGWLKAVVWGFEQRPECDVIYGAFVIDDIERVNRQGHGELPRIVFLPYDRHGLTQANIADMGSIAHRAGLPEAHFDESLREMGDWDLLLRLTRDMPPLALPAVSCFYTTDAPDRLSGGPTYESDAARVRSKNAMPHV